MSHGPALAHDAVAQVPRSNTAKAWAPDPQWLTLPTIPNGTQRVVILAAVYPGNNFTAFLARGAYRVDWGDGNGWENVADNTQVNKNLAWASYSSSTLTRWGYRQAIITIEPQDGQNLTVLDFYRKHNQSGLPNDMSSRFLDMKISGPNLTGLQVGANSTANVQHSMLERIEMQGTTSLVNTSNVFYNCRALRKFVGTQWCSGITSFAAMFRACYNLREVPLFDMSANLNTGEMFFDCRSLATVPLFDLNGVTNTSNMFAGCRSLRSVPFFDMSTVTVANAMFNSSGVDTLPAFNLSACTTLDSFCSSSAIVTFPAITTTSTLTNTYRMFYSCSYLKSVALFETSGVTNAGEMFNGCALLRSIPAFTLSATTTLYRFAAGCSYLQTCSIVCTGGVTSNLSETFSGDGQLTAVPLIDASACSNFNSTFAGCSSLQSSAMYGAKYGHGYPSVLLSASALNTIYTNLGTAAGTPTITVTGNFGTSGDDPTIATAKGWTVAS